MSDSCFCFLRCTFSLSVEPSLVQKIANRAEMSSRTLCLNKAAVYHRHDFGQGSLFLRGRIFSFRGVGSFDVLRYPCIAIFTISKPMSPRFLPGKPPLCIQDSSSRSRSEQAYPSCLIGFVDIVGPTLFLTAPLEERNEENPRCRTRSASRTLFRLQT